LEFDSELPCHESKKHKCYDTSVTECPIIGLHHIQLAMPAGREGVARRFYSGLLGIPEVGKPPELAKRGGVWFETNCVRVHLGVEQDFRPARKAHPGLLVRDLQSLSKRLAEAGYEVTNGEQARRLRARLRE
jgi:hypothetical protein